jgi:hypothetical protein
MASSKGAARRHSHRKKRPEIKVDGRPSAVATCQACGKRSYASRKAAKSAARLLFPGKDMHLYQCPASEEYWHITSIPLPEVIQWRKYNEKRRTR